MVMTCDFHFLRVSIAARTTLPPRVAAHARHHCPSAVILSDPPDME